LLKVEDNIQKLDSGIEDTIRLIDCPSSNFKLADVVANLEAFDGKVIIQTMFLKGVYKDQLIDNTTEQEITCWLQLIEQIKPSKVMIYTIDRDTPAQGLKKVTLPELEKIAQRIRKAGFEVSVSG
jgi:wyosine [tRNA(Phe)-imidazoG37] synthetase (radical SAM superfamily)